jgi:hypothetical protein
MDQIIFILVNFWSCNLNVHGCAGAQFVFARGLYKQMYDVGK